MHPVVVDPQFPSLELDSAETLLNDAARADARLRRLAPDMEPFQRLLLRGEYALLQLVLDTIETQLKHSISEKARRLGIV